MPIQIPQGFGQQNFNPGGEAFSKSYDMNTQQLGPALLQHQTQMALANAQLEATKAYHQQTLLQSAQNLQQTKEWHDMLDASKKAEIANQKQQILQAGTQGTYNAIMSPPQEKTAEGLIKQQRYQQFLNQNQGFLNPKQVGPVMAPFLHPFAANKAINAPITSADIMSNQLPQYQRIQGAIPQAGGQPPLMGNNLMDPHAQIMSMISNMGPMGLSAWQGIKQQGITDPNQIMAALQQAQQMQGMQAATPAPTQAPVPQQ